MATNLCGIYRYNYVIECLLVPKVLPSSQQRSIRTSLYDGQNKFTYLCWAENFKNIINYKGQYHKYTYTAVVFLIHCVYHFAAKVPIPKKPVIRLEPNIMRD
jgi:hypothetical protein